MKREDMVIISVDDHITEPGTVFDKHLSGDANARRYRIARAMK